jgi:hypothetical protein
MTVSAGHSATDPREASETLPDLAPEEIEPGFAPCPRDSVVSTRFGDEVLIVDSNTGRMHILNTTAAIAWECFDGDVTLDELAADLADGFHAPLEVVRTDTVEMTRELGRLGLVAGIAPPTPEASPMAGPLEVGDQVDTLSVIASEGSDAQVPRPGEATLLVNWSPFCGYCAKIGADLARCRPALAERGIALVLLTVGTPENNDGTLTPYGLSDFAFYRREPGDSDEGAPRDPFGLLGTPAAYLLDSEGRVSEPLAYGSVDVPALARKAAGLPADDAADSAGRGGGDEPSGAPRRTLPGASGVCSPSVGQAGKKPRQWAVTSAYAIGEFHVGIRADSLASDDLLARAFGSYRLKGDTSAPDNFSVVFGDDGDTGSKALSLLLAGDSTKVRSRSPRRILCALRSHLSALLEIDAEGLILTTNVAALVGDQAVLLPPVALYWMDYLQARLARLDVRVSDEPHALVDPDKRELVIPEPQVEIAPEVLAELAELAPSRTELLPMEPGRYRLGVWTFEDEPSRRSATPSRASAVAGILPAVTGSPEQLGEVIVAVGRLLEETRAVALGSTSPQELIKSIEERVLHSPPRLG